MIFSSCTFPGCEKAFRTNSHRSTHMDLHNSSKSFRCSTCSAMFQTRGSKRIHEKTHNTVLSKCGLCHKDFRQRGHYVRHVNAVHHLQCTSYNLEEVISIAKKNEIAES